MPGRDGPENLRFWKSELKVDIGPLGQKVEFSIVAAAVKFFGSRPVKINWDLKHHEMRRTFRVGLVWLRKTFKNWVSLLVSKNRTQKFIKPFVPEQRSPLVFACICVFVFARISLYMNMYLYYCWYRYHYGFQYTTLNSRTILRVLTFTILSIYLSIYSVTRI